MTLRANRNCRGRGTGRSLAVVRVVRAGAGSVCRDRGFRRAGGSRLDAGLAVERTRRIPDECLVRVEALIDRGDRLPVEQLERYEQRRDRHGTEVQVVAERQVHLVVGRQAARVAALRVVERRAVARVVRSRARRSAGRCGRRIAGRPRGPTARYRPRRSGPGSAGRARGGRRSSA